MAETESIELVKDPKQSLKWYVIHTASGHENKVAVTIRQRIEASELQDQVPEVLVPTQNKIVVESGKKKEVVERLFPGYVLVKMILNDDTWRAVRNTAGVTGFVGVGAKPTPVPDNEVEAILRFMKMEAPKFEAKYNVGDSVKVTQGPFTDFLGKVDKIDEDKGQVTVLISIFGRETPVELDFSQVIPL